MIKASSGLLCLPLSVRGLSHGGHALSFASLAHIIRGFGHCVTLAREDELLYRRDLTKADLSISCGICTHTATAAQYLDLELQLQLQTLI